jgi:hypothetical protein
MASLAQNNEQTLPPVNIKPLLTKLWPNSDNVTPSEIAEAISHFFTNQVSAAQTSALLMALHFTRMDFRADVLAESARVMREAAAPIPVKELLEVIERRGRKEGNYNGGLVSQTLLHFAEITANVNSVILLELVVTHTTPSTSARPHLFLLPRSSWYPSMETGLALRSRVALTWSTT